MAARSLHALRDSGELSSQLEALRELEQRANIEAANCHSLFTSGVYYRMIEGHDKLQAILEEQLVRIYGEITSVSHQLDENEMCEILQWICSVPHQTDHYNARSGRIKGTGQWLLAHPTFKEWRESSASMILWLHGIRRYQAKVPQNQNSDQNQIAGAGKTKLSTTVVDDRISFVREKKSSEAVAYFYCDRNRQDRQSPINVLRSFVRQLSTGPDGERLVGFVHELYVRHRKSGFAEESLGYEESTSLLLRLLDVFSQTTLVLDGLDECDTETRLCLIQALDRLIEKSSGLIKIFIASRNDKDLTNRYEGGHNLEIQASDNQQDIELFVESKMQQSAWCRDYMPLAVRREVLRTFRKKSQGMYVCTFPLFNHAV